MKLRKLNEQGLKTFREFLADARESGLRPPDVPKMLLTLPTTSEELAQGLELDPLFYPKTNYDLARSLHGLFDQIDAKVMEGSDGRGEPGFWGAVALFYFDLLTPDYPASRKEVKADICYIPASGTEIQLGRYFRHRIAGPIVSTNSTEKAANRSSCRHQANETRSTLRLPIPSSTPRLAASWRRSTPSTSTLASEN